MLDKIDEEFTIINPDRLRALGQSVWEETPRAICSVDFIKSHMMEKNPDRRRRRYTPYILKSTWPKDLKYDFIIFDESQYAKSNTAKRYKATWQLVEQLREQDGFILLLTATPVMNREEELYYQLVLTYPDLLTSPDGKRDTPKKSDLDALGEQWLTLRRETIRRKLRRDDDIRSLFAERRPPEDVTFEMTPAESELYSDFARYISDESEYYKLISIRAQAEGSPFAKEKEFVRKVQDILAQGTARNRRKAIVFLAYIPTGEKLENLLRAEGIHTAFYQGGLNEHQRKRLIDRLWGRIEEKYRDDPDRGEIDVLLATDAGGVGLNLQAANHVVNYDLSWNPMVVEQRVGRVHRLGQRRKHVFVENFFTRTGGDDETRVLSIEENLHTALADKVSLIRGLGIELSDEVISDELLADSELAEAELRFRTRTIGEDQYRRIVERVVRRKAEELKQLSDLKALVSVTDETERARAVQQSHIFDYYCAEMLNLLKEQYAEHITNHRDGSMTVIASAGPPLEDDSDNQFYYHRNVRYWMKVLDHHSHYRLGSRAPEKSPESKIISLADGLKREVFVALLSSNLFYWFQTLFSEMRHVPRSVVMRIPFDYESLTKEQQQRLVSLCRELMKDYKAKACRRVTNNARVGRLEYDEYYPARSRQIIEQIDDVLAQHYGLTSEELHFMKSYDLEFRIGADTLEDNEEG